MNIPVDDLLVQNITNQFNDSIVFPPNKPLMAYTIRDPIINRIFQNETNRGFAKKLVCQSRCFDAVLVIDGGCSYQFNDGAKAILETLPEDSLRTVNVFNDDWQRLYKDMRHEYLVFFFFSSSFFKFLLFNFNRFVREI